MRARSHTLSSSTSHWETQCVFQCLSLVQSSIMHGFGRMKGWFGFRHVPHMEREKDIIAGSKNCKNSIDAKDVKSFFFLESVQKNWCYQSFSSG